MQSRSGMGSRSKQTSSFLQRLKTLRKNYWGNGDTTSKGNCDLCFCLQRAPLKRARLLLNTEYSEGNHKILHVHVPTLLHGSDSHLVVATVIGEDSRLHDQKSEQKKIRTELINWFGSDAKDWSFIGTTYVDYALPSGGTTATGRERQSLIQDGIYCIGDHTMHPSVKEPCVQLSDCWSTSRFQSP